MLFTSSHLLGITIKPGTNGWSQDCISAKMNTTISWDHTSNYQTQFCTVLLISWYHGVVSVSLLRSSWSEILSAPLRNSVSVTQVLGRAAQWRHHCYIIARAEVTCPRTDQIISSCCHLDTDLCLHSNDAVQTFTIQDAVSRVVQYAWVHL